MIFSILVSFLFSMEWYWMQAQRIPTCLCTSGRSVILSKVQHLWNRLEIVQWLMMKVSFGSSKFCPSLFTQSVGIITSKLNLLFWNALQNVVFKLHSDGLPDLSLNLNKLHFSFLCKVWTVVKCMLLNWIIILSWEALFLIYLMFSNKEKKKLVLKQIILSIGLAVWLGRSCTYHWKRIIRWSPCLWKSLFQSYFFGIMYSCLKFNAGSGNFML